MLLRVEGSRLMFYMVMAALVASSIAVPGLSAQQATAPAPSAPSATTMTGCVSPKPTAGQYVFADANGVGQYRLTGKQMRKYAGQRVEIAGGSPKGLSIKGGLWPAPSGGARGVAQDPSDAAIAIHQGNAGGAAGAIPEFRVSSVKAVPGACE
jgi:hypothetical protein